MKALFIGLGSAGQRHLRNLLEVCGGNVEIMAYRRHKSERVFTPDMQIMPGETLAEKYNIREFGDYGEALDACPDIVFITNPNSLHMEYAVRAAERGFDLFIEKPLTTTLDQADTLLRLIEKEKIVCQTGYQYRYHPCIRMTKEYLGNRKLGRIVTAEAQIGECLPMMHRYEDYRGMTESRSELGGGVVLSQIHELDFLQWMFGVPDRVYSVGGKEGEFDIDVEDTATTMFRYNSGARGPAVVLHQDFFQYPPVRKCRIIGTGGRIEINLLENQFLFEEYETQNKLEEHFDDFEKNDMFMAELKDFLHCVATREEPGCKVVSALASTRVALAIKKSFMQGREVWLNEEF